MKTIELGTYTPRKKEIKVTKRKFKWRYVIIILLVLLITGINAGISYAYTQMTKSCSEGETCNNNILTTPINTLKNPLQGELKQNNGITNVLIVGIDTRGEDSGLKNTDTLMVISVDRNNDSIMMTSIPRDLWVAYTIEGAGTYQSKINGVFANAEATGKSGMDTMQTLAEDITGLPIHYTVLMTLQGFRDVINAVDGVDIDVPQGFTGLYPNEAHPEQGYFVVSFNTGVNHMDGETALRYARIRNVDGPEGSDFARARRQQVVIDTLKKKVLASETLRNPTKLWEIYNIVKNNIETSEFSLTDIKAALDLRPFAESATVVNVVLDPNFGGYERFIFTANLDPNRGYSIQAWDSTYSDIQAQLELIRKNPKIYKEEPSVAIYNAMTIDSTINYGDIINKKNPLFNVVANDIALKYTTDKTGVVIVDYTEGKKQGSIDYLKETFGITDVITDMSIAPKRLFNEDLAIVIIDENSQNSVEGTSFSSSN